MISLLPKWDILFFSLMLQTKSDVLTEGWKLEGDSADTSVISTSENVLNALLVYLSLSEILSPITVQ